MAESNVKELTATEQKLLDKLLADPSLLDKIMAGASAAKPHGPAVRVGEPYVALTNLSLPRRELTRDKDGFRQADLVLAGETVYLTPDEVSLFERHDPRDGRRVSVVRRKTEVDSNNPPRPHPSYLSGPVFRPAQPPRGSDLPRPDPEGSTQVLSYGPPVPEANQPVPGTENGPPATAEPDAMDIAVGGGQLARDEIRMGADQDLLAAVKAQTGVDKPSGNRR